MMSREAQRSSSRSFFYMFRLLFLMPMLRAPSTRAAGILVFEAGPARPAVLNDEGSRHVALDVPSNGLTIFAIDAQPELREPCVRTPSRPATSHAPLLGRPAVLLTWSMD